MPTEIFFSYAHEDEDLMNAVRSQLVVFERQGKIVKWHDRQIPPGMEWEPTIDERLQHSKVILLFVSPAFLESRYCWDVEVRIALERHERGDARVIPIIVRPCAWDASPFAKLQALPLDAKPLIQFSDRDQASLDVARSIMRVVEEIDSIAGSSPRLNEGGSRVKRGVHRRKLQGDKIPRIVVDFTPPTAINIPTGYQRRLNQIAADVSRDAAVRLDTGEFEYPVQIQGNARDVSAFVEEVSANGKLNHLGIDIESTPAEAWFEYVGTLPPDILRDQATQRGLTVVHYGATLLISMPTSGSKTAAHGL
jgi:hypothetical protein